MSPRPPPKISLCHDWTKELDSNFDRQPEGEVTRQSQREVARQAKFFQPTQPKLKSVIDRGKPENTEDVIVVIGETSGSHEIDEKGLHEELGSPHRSGEPDKLSEKSVLSKLTMDKANLMSETTQVHTQ